MGTLEYLPQKGEWETQGRYLGANKGSEVGSVLERERRIVKLEQNG